MKSVKWMLQLPTEFVQNLQAYIQISSFETFKSFPLRPAVAEHWRLLLRYFFFEEP
jgi:hypothetical protein